MPTLMMIRSRVIVRATATTILAVLVGLSVMGSAAAQDDAVKRGEYVFHAAGCHACHTDTEGGGKALAGGRPFDTPFGRFYSPNITPHAEHGIGNWTTEDLWRGLTQGEGPGGTHYYPVFPFPSYAAMARSDADDLHAYLMSVTPVAVPSREHDLPWFLSWRLAARIWKWMFLEEGTFKPRPDKSEAWNRGAYLVNALSHCGECHTPRGRPGNLLRDEHLSGNPQGPGGEAVPGIRSDTEDGLEAWSESEIVTYLKSGENPDFDFAGGEMVTVIEDSTSKLTDEDLAAIAMYLKDL